MKWSALVLVIAGLAIASQLAWQVDRFLTAPLSNQTEAVIVTIPSGSSAHKIAHILQSEGLLSSPKWFVWYLRYQEKQNQLKAGEIRVDPRWNVDTLISKLIEGQVVQYPITLIAGQTIQQNLAIIQALPKIKKVLDYENIVGLEKLFGQDKPFDKRYPYANIEGLLLPETYHYKAGDTDKEILLRAHKALNTTLNQSWSNREKGLPFKTPYEALIMASIVEKETGFAAERPKIAGVFIRRMRIGMRLQTDPTVIYGIGLGYDGNIRKRDLLKKTRYNTYKIDGLPPTPIALASKEAILAVLHPEHTKALYFVAKGGGQHQFSNTLKAHNRAVRDYLRNR
ncbi:MAG: endolytic transglycosylase MltG [Gammaproteobacteria bacterium]|nr:endolytic transglycosylase MltG [Gammaproteobacteria bacterium]